jgi:hypothetical protein
MIACLVTVVEFTLIGWSVSRFLRMQRSGTLAGEFATYYLLGVAANGIFLYLLAIVHVSINWVTELGVLAGSVAVAAFARGAAAPRRALRHSRFATLLLVLPCTVLAGAAAVLPIRDYDGRVTWLPKAYAIATTGSIEGSFFQGTEGLNLHNHYPLLLPLDAASVMGLCGSTTNETTRWLYALIPIAALFAVRDLLQPFAGEDGAWTIAAVAWLPVLTNIEGGALAAYNDWAIAAFTGLAVLYAMRTEPSAPRVVALMLATLTLTKNEGMIIGGAVVAAMLLARAAKKWLLLLAPLVAASAVLALWRTRVPAAYDEQYAILVRELPNRWHRAPAALAALASHALEGAAWGYFWPVTVLALTITMTLCRTRIVIPATTLALVLAADVIAFIVTSWDISELAGVAANRLLVHATMPACIIIATAANAIRTGRNVLSRTHSNSENA